VLEAEAESRVARALDIRRAANRAAELPSHWLLDSPALTGVVEMAARLARTPVPVLIEGERGTGVLELARSIHEADPGARSGKLRAIAAHLFAPSDVRGAALSGTLFIQDIENLRPPGQEWVLERLATRLESAQPLRIIAGSRESAGELLGRAGLNQELVHALDVGRLVIPPLRHRMGDILLLARRFLRHCADRHGRSSLRFSEAAECKLVTHTYPANVRELRNIVERAVALATSDEVGEDAIVIFEADGTTRVPADRLRPWVAANRCGASQFPTLADVERDYLVGLIREFKGRRFSIARAMGVSYPTVVKKIARHHLDVRAIVESTPMFGDSKGAALSTAG
jgi:DNA-binding NtrC family response regulator